MKKNNLIALVGGGTLGSVTPLLAVVEQLRNLDANKQYLWFGTKQGPEYSLIQEQKIYFVPITSGKWRRYFSLRNFIDPFKVSWGVIQSLYYLLKYKPQVVVSAGGFVAVPVNLAAFVLRIPIIIHQQDVVPSLANKIIAPLAKKITLALSESAQYFNQTKTVVVGNPVRASILSGQPQRFYDKFKINEKLPVVLILGGGTGAVAINQATVAALPVLTGKALIVNSTGGGNLLAPPARNYWPFELLTTDLADVLAAATVVVSRAGFGVLTELSALAKPAIIIPLPDSHQQRNADYFARRNAVALLDQKNLTAQSLAQAVAELLSNNVELQTLSRNISQALLTKDSDIKLAQQVLSVI